MTEQYIHVVGWERHQHPDAARSSVPPWIKVYTELLSSDAYLDLTEHQALVLHRLWLEYARARRHLRLNTRSLSRHLHLRVMTRDIEALNHAGFLTLSASTDARPEKNRREESRKPPLSPFDSRTQIVHDMLAVIDKPGYDESKLTEQRISDVISRHPGLDVALEAEKLADWERFGAGEGKATKDGIARFRSWLKKATEPRASGVAEPEVDYPWHPEITPPENWMQ